MKQLLVFATLWGESLANVSGSIEYYYKRRKASKSIIVMEMVWITVEKIYD